ncbi:serine/threonine-protein kinase AtPK2/AtPK19-like [Prunus yedoensis var. nudiflora]|uniref:Serine/threonine-protein kinase AtPK2/AtPK19-like n=1 Tax=Prunus yedoensis var. nudiflora TaxID=2094558 RepID=A0A314Z5T2_PRUYE|nr:serine/threonine-protein kinase AtPK2/AtPK19-like [Prunus yedoensis var. nudiflora]
MVSSSQKKSLHSLLAAKLSNLTIPPSSSSSSSSPPQTSTLTTSSAPTATPNDQSTSATSLLRLHWSSTTALTPSWAPPRASLRLPPSLSLPNSSIPRATKTNRKTQTELIIGMIGNRKRRASQRESS